MQRQIRLLGEVVSRVVIKKTDVCTYRHMSKGQNVRLRTLYSFIRIPFDRTFYRLFSLRCRFMLRSQFTTDKNVSIFFFEHFLFKRYVCQFERGRQYFWKITVIWKHKLPRSTRNTVLSIEHRCIRLQCYKVVCTISVIITYSGIEKY